MQIQLAKTLDVEVVERQLAELWKQTSGDARPVDDFAVLRARVANLMVYVANESLVADVNGIVAKLTTMHPSRVLLLLGEKNGKERDIEMSLDTFRQSDERTGANRLCCEQVTLSASGNFVSELPSAAVPLLVPDLTTFLWWRDALASDKQDKVFDALLRASDRLIVDSAEFVEPKSDLLALTRLFNGQAHSDVGISDLNWARLTAWRALLAGFYDVPAYQPLLDRVDTVRIDYLAPTTSPSALEDAGAHGASVAPQALLIAGWLASRLGWTLTEAPPLHHEDDSTVFKFSGTAAGSRRTEDSGRSPTVREGSNPNDHYIKLALNRVERAEGKPGRLVRVELQSNSGQPASFKVERSPDNLHLTTEAQVGRDVQRGRVVPVRNRSAAQLLGREMEILCNDQIYQDALAMATGMIERSTSPR